jgi:predicted XRE-type DNA-binding protein
MRLQITESTGDVFRDLGFDVNESADLGLRSNLITAVRKRIAERTARGESQTDIANLLGVTQPRVSDLKRGKIHLFSVEMLAGMLARLGAEVAVSVITPRRDRFIDVINTLQATQVLFTQKMVWTTVVATSLPALGMVGTFSYGVFRSPEIEPELTWAAALIGSDTKPFVEYERGSTAKPLAANTQLALAA